MKLMWIEDLLAIAESRSLSEAAERRHVTQPAFSRRIRAIEEHLGVALVDRSRRPARPIQAVLERVEQLRGLAGGLRQLPDDLAASGQRAERRVVIASQHALTISVAPGLTQRIVRAFDNATVRLRSANRDECLAMLMTRQASMMLAYETETLPVVPDDEFVERQRLAEERLIPVVVPASPAAGWDGGAAFELPIVAYPDEVFLGRVMSRDILPSITRHGRYVRVVETALTLAARELALAGLGAAWIPESLVRRDLEHGRLAVLPGDFARCVMSLVALRLRTPKSAAEGIAWNAIVGRVSPPADESKGRRKRS